MPFDASAVKRFEASYGIDASGCWVWLRALNWNGYGLIRHRGRQLRAHRFAYELYVGPIPPALTLDHLCRDRGCVNPAHLEPVTRAENVLRGRGPSGVCLH